MDFSYDSLRTFIQLCNKRSFTVAAELVHRSQSAVSIQIRVLEERVGLKLFDRSRKPMELTEAGRIFLQFAKETVDKADSLDRLFKELISGTVGEVRIGATTSIGTYLLPPIIGNILKEYPELRINVYTQGRQMVCEAVRQREVDFAIILSDKPPGGLGTKRLRDERLCFVASLRHPLARRESVTIEDLRSATFAVGSKGNEYTAMVDRMLEKSGLSKYNIGYRMNNFEGRKECVRAGVGLTILPEFTVRQEMQRKSLVEITVRRVQLGASIMLIEAPRRVVSPSVRFVKSLIEKGI